MTNAQPRIDFGRPLRRPAGLSRLICDITPIDLGEGRPYLLTVWGHGFLAAVFGPSCFATGNERDPNLPLISGHPLQHGEYGTMVPLYGCRALGGAVACARASRGAACG